MKHCKYRRCKNKLEGRQKLYCRELCKYAAWYEKRLGEPYNGWQPLRKGAHGERGARIYFTPEDLSELFAIVQSASPRIYDKVRAARERLPSGVRR